MAQYDADDLIRLQDGELAELISYGAEAPDQGVVAGTFPATHLIVSQSSPSIIEKLAAMRGVTPSITEGDE